MNTASVSATVLVISNVFHADHGVSSDLMTWAVNTVKPTGFFATTLTIPAEEPDLTNNLYGPASGDAPIKGQVIVRDVNDVSRGATPFVDAPPRPTRLLTIIGMVGEDNTVSIFTAYGGPLAERVPSDPSLREDPVGREIATKFWEEHALSICSKL